MTTIAPLRATVAQSMRLKTDREVIEGALALIEADGGWTQGTYCRDAAGAEVHPAVDSPGEWVRVRTEHVGGGGYVVRTESGAPRAASAWAGRCAQRRVTGTPCIPTPHTRKSSAWNTCCCSWPTPPLHRAGRP